MQSEHIGQNRSLAHLQTKRLRCCGLKQRWVALRRFVADSEDQPWLQTCLLLWRQLSFQAYHPCVILLHVLPAVGNKDDLAACQLQVFVDFHVWLLIRPAGMETASLAWSLASNPVASGPRGSGSWFVKVLRRRTYQRPWSGRQTARTRLTS